MAFQRALVFAQVVVHQTYVALHFGQHARVVQASKDLGRLVVVGQRFALIAHSGKRNTGILERVRLARPVARGAQQG